MNSLLTNPRANVHVLNRVFKILSFAAALIVFASTIAFARSTDNVFLIEGIETWQFVASEGNAPAHVKNHITHVYEATRYKESIQPHVFYNNRLKLDKASGKGKARYESAPSRNVFHDDNRVCYFDMRLEGPGKKSKAQFERTLTDPAFFTLLHLSDQFPIKHKEVRIVIPPDYPGITVEELNFTPSEESCISRRLEEFPDGSRAYIYELNNLEGIQKSNEESSVPYPLLFRPVLLIKGWFGSIDRLSQWHVDMNRVDTEIRDIDLFLEENVYGQKSDALTSRQKLENIYSWVQKNIRYVAYEEGESGHRPDMPAEVLRKRYGDCKGMALLLATLLRHEGIKANAAVIGTNHIPFEIAENHSLAATNHSICIAKEGGETFYLDATNEYIPANHIPAAIQGKDAIVLSWGDEACRLQKLPLLSPSATAVDSVSYNYSLDCVHERMSGLVKRSLSGDFKEIYMTIYTRKGDKYIRENMAIDLVPQRRSAIPVEELNYRTDAPDGSAVIEARIENTEAIISTGTTIYADLNSQNGIIPDRIDNHDRHSPYLFPTRGRIVRQTKLSLPAKAEVAHLPQDYMATTRNAEFKCLFTHTDDNSVIMTKSIEIINPLIDVDEIDLWNKTFSEWDNACKSQVEIFTN